METAAGDRSTLYLPEHFDGANGAMTENGKHPRCEYDKVASEALERGPASAGTASGEDGHGAMNHSAGWTREEEGGETPRPARSAQESNGREMEERPPPQTVART